MNLITQINPSISRLSMIITQQNFQCSLKHRNSSAAGAASGDGRSASRRTAAPPGQAAWSSCDCGTWGRQRFTLG